MRTILKTWHTCEALFEAKSSKRSIESASRRLREKSLIFVKHVVELMKCAQMIRKSAVTALKK